MPIPDFQSMFRPMLVLLSDGEPRPVSDLREGIASKFSVSPEERLEKLPSGKGRIFDNRVAWTYVHLFHADAIERLERGVYRITHRGKELLESEPERITMATLRQFPEYAKFVEPKPKAGEKTPPPPPPDTPLERMSAAQTEIDDALAEDLLQRIMDQGPTFFEKLVLNVVEALGYGDGSEAEHLGKSGDEGVDGVIYEDQLGFDRIYLQAKRWVANVQRQEVQKFVGALEGKKATKGVFITTSTFSPNAKAYADGLSKRVVLIDGDQLVRLMIQHEVGVRVYEQFAARELDENYFLSE